MRERVVLVEDDPALQRAITRELRREFDVLPVDDYDDALVELGRSDQIAAVVSDFDLGPGPNGLQVLTAAVTMAPRAARILVSATAKMPSGQAVLGGIVHRFVKKPWKRDELVAVVRRCIGQLGQGGQAGSGTRRIDGVEEPAERDVAAPSKPRR